MASHIILPPEDADDNHHREEDGEEEEEREELGHDDGERAPPEQAPKAALPFSATCVRISRDSYPNLRALRNASALDLHDDDAAFVKLEEGDYGYVLDDVPHLTDYLPDLPVSAAAPLSRALRLLCCLICCSWVKIATMNRNDACDGIEDLDSASFRFGTISKVI